MASDRSHVLSSKHRSRRVRVAHVPRLSCHLSPGPALDEAPAAAERALHVGGLDLLDRERGGHQPVLLLGALLACGQLPEPRQIAGLSLCDVHRLLHRRGIMPRAEEHHLTTESMAQCPTCAERARDRAGSRIIQYYCTYLIAINTSCGTLLFNSTLATHSLTITDRLSGVKCIMLPACANAAS